MLKNLPTIFIIKLNQSLFISCVWLNFLDNLDSVFKRVFCFVLNHMLICYIVISIFLSYPFDIFLCTLTHSPYTQPS